jgi:RNA polymerase sigma-70 factor (ECF subfamily)
MNQPANAPPATHDTEAALRDFREPLERYATHLLGGDHARAQDIAQDTFERLLRQPAERRDELTAGRLKAWLFTVCRNRALDIRRKERRMTTLTPPIADAQHAHAPGPADAAQQRDTHDAVLRRMAKLPDNQQEVLRLRFHGELTYPQIAEVTGLSVGHVGYLLHHALKTLRQQLA